MGGVLLCSPVGTAAACFSQINPAERQMRQTTIRSTGTHHTHPRLTIASTGPIHPFPALAGAFFMGNTVTSWGNFHRAAGNFHRAENKFFQILIGARSALFLRKQGNASV
jgi:hypothetical protein